MQVKILNLVGIDLQENGNLEPERDLENVRHAERQNMNESKSSEVSRRSTVLLRDLGESVKEEPLVCDEGKPVMCEEVLERCCGTGRWQLLLISYLSLMWLLFPSLSMSMMFAGATPHFRCADGFDTSATYEDLPPDTPTCHPHGSFSNSSTPQSGCLRWVFDRSVFLSTAVTEWNLVCQRKPLLSLLQSWLMIGGLASSLLCGDLADRLGRRPVYLAAMLVLQVCVYAAAAAPSYSFFAAVRFVTGAAMTAMVGAQTIMVAELTTPSRRALLCFLSVMPFSFGTMLVSLTSYLVRDRWLMQLALAVPFLLLLPSYWLLPETPRWLVAKGRFEKAYSVLATAARWNGRQLPEKESVLALMAAAQRGTALREANLKSSASRSVTSQLLRLVRTPRMRRYTLASAFVYFVISGSYFGVSFDMTQVSSSRHLAAVLTAVAELPAYFSFPLLDRLGRRIAVLLFLLTAAAAMLLVPMVPQNTLWVVLGVVAKCGISCSFNAVFLYLSEYMPTPVRALAFGVCQSCMRLGATVSPFVVDLVGELHPAAPSGVFGGGLLLAALACLLLPETNGRPMPETEADVERPPPRRAADPRGERPPPGGEKPSPSGEQPPPSGEKPSPTEEQPQHSRTAIGP